MTAEDIGDMLGRAMLGTLRKSSLTTIARWGKRCPPARIREQKQKSVGRLPFVIRDDVGTEWGRLL